MRKLINKKGAVIGLATASTVALTLGTVLPLTLNKSISTYHNQQQKYQLISGLNPTTDYEVGTPISLELNPVSQVDYNNHNFEWYMGTSSGDARLYQTTTAPKITLTNIGAAFDNAYIFCVLVPNAEINTLHNFYNTQSTSTPKSSNVVYYAQTQLKLDTPFAIESCEVVPTSESINNKVIFSDDVALVPNNTGLSLEVFVTTKGEDYEKYATYQWYCNGQKLENQTSSVLSISPQDLKTGNEYSCEAKLVAGSESSKAVMSSPVLVNIVNSTTLIGHTPTIIVNGKPLAQSTIATQSNVQLTARFSLGVDPVTMDNSEYKVTYQWLKDNKIYSKANNADTLNLSDVTTADVGSYSCVAYLEFKNGGTLMTVTPTAIVNVVQPGVISIAKNLSDATIINGQGYDLSILATLENESKPLTYTWFYKAPSGTWTQMQSVNTNSVKLTPEEALAANGYQFKCTVSDPQTESHVTPVTTETMILTVQNPSFTVRLSSSPQNTTNLPYGSDLTLTASVLDNTPLEPNNKFKVQYGYQ